MDDCHADLVRLGDRIDELIQRVKRFDHEYQDLNGVDDLVTIAEEIQILQTQLSLPKIAEMCLTKKANIVAFKVWDPQFPGRGMQGYIAQLAFWNKHDASLNATNLPIINDYLGRSLRYVKLLLREQNESGARPASVINAQSSQPPELEERTYRNVEIAKLLNVSKQAVTNWAKRAPNAFPKETRAKASKWQSFIRQAWPDGEYDPNKIPMY